MTPLLTGAGATFLADSIANLSLEIGAVAGRAETEWNCQTENLQLLRRDYLLAHLRFAIESTIISSLVSILRTAVLGVNVGGVAGLSVNATVLTDGPLPSGTSQPIQADLAAGTITVDIGALLGGDAFGVNYSQWLNGCPANTVLFVDTPVPAGAITTFMSGLITGLQNRLLDAVSVTILGRTGTLRQLQSIPLVGTILRTLISAINALFTAAGPVRTALDAISSLLSTVFDWLTEVLNLRVKAQNQPEANTVNSASLHPGAHPLAVAARGTLRRGRPRGERAAGRHAAGPLPGPPERRPHHRAVSGRPAAVGTAAALRPRTARRCAGPCRPAR